jgi:multiple sugar transport system ATP-binding protein
LNLPPTVLSVLPSLARYANKEVVVGIRPESLSISGAATQRGVKDHISFEGDVDLVEALGSEILVHFSTDAHRVEAEGMYSEDAQGLDAGLITQRGEGVARVAPETHVVVGERVKLHVNPTRLFFFDPASGHSLSD